LGLVFQPNDFLHPGTVLQVIADAAMQVQGIDGFETPDEIDRFDIVLRIELILCLWYST